MKHNFIFFGTDDFSVAVLEELKKAGFLPAQIVTMPDKPRDRGLALTNPPVKTWAQENKITLLQPEKLDQEISILLQSMIVECFIVASYGKIIPLAILEIPKKGALNLHPSLLPKYRGATPIESQILVDEKEIGVTIILMDEKMDHGPVVAQQRLEETGIFKASELRKKLAQLGGKLLVELLPKLMAGEIKSTPQDESRATYTKKLEKKDGEINLHDDSYKNFLKIQAFDGSIGSYFFAERNGKKTRVTIKDAEMKEGNLILTRVVPEGKKEMSYEEFLRGLR